jgi:uncharacterized protein YndB with AHSA1/START domain
MSCVTREIVLPVTRERAWELVTDEDELREWLADDVEFEAEEGAPLRADDRDGVVELVEDEERIVFTWGGSRVEWRLDEVPGGTRFTVTEERHDFVFGPTLSASGPTSSVGGSAWGPKLSALASAAMLCPA